MKSFRDLQTEQDITDWVIDLNETWPERVRVMEHIVRQVEELPFETLHLVELAPGPGHLAERLLGEIPRLAYTGLDSSELLLAYARRRLARFGPRGELIQTDLNKERWPALLPGRVQAIVSMQSFHDLGAEEQINRAYGLAKTLLVRGGLLLNADLVVPAGQTDPERPGRLSVDRHLALLRAHGYTGMACSLETGEFGCVVARIPKL